MPSVVVLAIACDTYAVSPRTELPDALQCLLHFILSAHNSHQILHCFLKVVLNLIGIFARITAIEGGKSGIRG